MGMTRNLFKKIGDIKGIFHARRDRSSMDLRGAEEIKKKWQEYTEELYKKSFNDLDSHNYLVKQSQTLWNVNFSGP